MEQEARALARVEHSHVVQIRNVLEERGILVLELELLTGGDVAGRLRDGPIDVDDAVAWASQMLEGLQALHDADLVHRDIKPGNLLLTGQGVLKLTDLGIARDGKASEHTSLGAVLGTAGYMSPEQVQGLTVDHRTDIYAAGVVLFEMLVGKLPYQATTDWQLRMAHVQQQPDLRPVQTHAPHLAKVIERALAKDPQDRWQSAAQMLKAMAELPMPDTALASLPGREAAAGEVTPPQRHNSALRPNVVAAVGAAIVFGGVGATAVMLLPDARPSMPEAAAPRAGKVNDSAGKTGAPTAAGPQLPKGTKEPTATALPKPDVPQPQAPQPAPPKPAVAPVDLATDLAWMRTMAHLPRGGIVSQLVGALGEASTPRLFAVSRATIEQHTDKIVQSDVRPTYTIRKFTAPSGRDSLLLLDVAETGVFRIGTWFSQRDQCDALPARLGTPWRRLPLNCGGELLTFAVGDMRLQLYIPQGRENCEWYLYGRPLTPEQAAEEDLVAQAYACNDAGVAAWKSSNAEAALASLRLALGLLPRYAKAAVRACEIAAFLGQADTATEFCGMATKSGFSEVKSCLRKMPERTTTLGGKLCI
jgi:hypothetical protein